MSNIPTDEPNTVGQACYEGWQHYWKSLYGFEYGEWIDLSLKSRAAWTAAGEAALKVVSEGKQP